jgi:hypothetical protein
MSNTTVETPGEGPNGVPGQAQPVLASPRCHASRASAWEHVRETAVRGHAIVMMYLVVVLVLGVIALSRVPAVDVPQLVTNLSGWLRV